MPTTVTEPRLREKYREDVVATLRERYSITNPMAVPNVRKVVVNMGVGIGKENKSAIDAAAQDLATITGQKAKLCRARRSVSGFKLRDGMPIGLMVTLRGVRMWEFLDRLISIAVPRIKDFRGLSRKSFDGRGNYSMGLSEQIVFPEIDPDRIQHQQGMDITIVTSADDDPQAETLLEGLGMPFRAK